MADEEEAKFRTLLELASQGVLLINEEGIIELANVHAGTIFGYNRDELVGQPLSRLIPERVRGLHARQCAGYFEHPRPRPMGVGMELTGQRKDGTELPVEVSLSAVDTSEGRLAMAFVTDISHRVEMAEALRQYSERLEEMVEARTEELRKTQARLLDQQRLQQEIEMAAQVQTSLLPKHPPDLQGYELSATGRPARYIGGDLYDFVSASETGTADKVWHLVVADISGKGIPAALLASAARTLVRVEAEHELSPQAILTYFNRNFYDELSQAEMFITLLVATLDTRRGTLTYTSAGHPDVLWWQAVPEKCARLPATGLPIGVLPDLNIVETRVKLRPGDMLVLYSDGVTEAESPTHEIFGQERLEALVRANARGSASELEGAILEAVRNHREGMPRSDDLTLIVLKALPHTVSFSLQGTLEHLHRATDLTRDLATPYGEEFAYQVELSVSELVTNIIQHAYHDSEGEIRGEICLRADGIEVRLWDKGKSFTPEELPSHVSPEPREGGYGLIIAHELSDELEYTTTAHENRWRMVKYAKENADDETADG
jgi:PAS domain S-box-containing protein